MRELLPVAEQIGALLKARKETVAVGESSAGGLISSHAWCAVTGPVERTQVISSGRADRVANMYAFAAAALDLFVKTLGARA